jgi:glycolate oxidase iron-sulfur subunit
MADMRALIALMREVEDQLTVCMRCGMCQAVCPLYAQTGREADVARGKLALLDGLLQEMFTRPDSVAERLNKCLLCGSCQANCPSGVRVIDIFLKARAVLAGFSGMSAAQKIVLKGLLAHPALLDQAAAWSAPLQKIFTRPAHELLGTSCARFTSPLLSPAMGERHFKPLAEEPFHRAVPALKTAAGRSGIKVAFFVGCLIDKIYPQVARAFMEICDHHGIGLFIPEGQGCCGIPALSAGDTDTFQRLVRHNLARFQRSPFDYLVTACATCTATIKEFWPMMLGDAPEALRAQVAALAEKTLDVSQFLIDKGIVDPGGQLPVITESVPVSYHDPCHLKKSLGVFAQPRALLNAANGYRRVELRAPDQCCGMGGSFNLKYYGISRRIGRRKRDDIRASGGRIVATSCPACMLQITDALSQAGDDVDVRHVIEIYAESLKHHANAPPAD